MFAAHFQPGSRQSDSLLIYLLRPPAKKAKDRLKPSVKRLSAMLCINVYIMQCMHVVVANTYDFFGGDNLCWGACASLGRSSR
jgi:hypothetical protein